ncbi:caudovirus prohead protease family protein (plasmid) [Clostridium botulinum]|uniref:HK97 family phage prohead protease n=1 Tax=Clostridium botulinum TaxID=1491 RepID=UPI0008FC6850|nr:HK97 family phage prohead protease [Clostridium botulinum]APC82261.1 caudovirus prohead protease family protein [Clostridium botulinum]
MDLEFKGLQIEIKEITEKGIFKGIASPFNNVDYGNDRVLPSVANKNNGKTVPYLWQHDTREPIGEVRLTSTNTGIDIEGKLYLDTLENGNPTIPNAYKAYTLMKNNKLKNSIGYKTLDYEYVTEGKKTIRNLKDIDIMEVSAVTFPMNPKANITDVKSQEGGAKVDLKEIEEKLNSIMETLKPQQEEKEFSDKIEEIKSLIETKAGAKISKSNKEKLKSTLKAIKELLGEDEEDQDQEEEPEEEQEDKKSKDKEEDKSKEKDRKEPKEEEEEEKEPNKQKKSNNDKIELKADEFEALESLYKNIVHKEDK